MCANKVVWHLVNYTGMTKWRGVETVTISSVTYAQLSSDLRHGSHDSAQLELEKGQL